MSIGDVVPIFKRYRMTVNMNLSFDGNMNQLVDIERYIEHIVASGTKADDVMAFEVEYVEIDGEG